MQYSLVLLLCSLLLAAPASAKDKIKKSDFKFGGKWRTYYSYVPDKEGPLPLVVLLHGSGRNGGIMASEWKRLASTENFIFVAPNSYDPAVWQFQKDGPDFIRAIVELVRAEHAVDDNRIYLFGHSGGAVYALALAVIDSEYFAATAVHAGALSPDRFSSVASAKRRMPIAIWVGDHDIFFPVDVVKMTKEVFESNGFHVELSILTNEGHNYESGAGDVNTKAWEFFRRTRLGQP
jgi:poly(3-hydroxybutyrate) depolymerase